MKPTLYVAHEGKRFRIGESGPVVEVRPASHRRILLELTRSTLPCPVEMLATFGWPGEKILPVAQAQRVYQATTMLRKGLRPVLRNTMGVGYWLDAAIVHTDKL